MKRWLALLLLLPCAAFGAEGPLVNASPTTITTGGTWQAMFPQNYNRSTLWIENPCNATTQGIVTAESLFVGFGTKPTSTTAGGVVELASCGSLVMTGPYVSQQAIWVESATSAHSFYGAQSQ